MTSTGRDRLTAHAAECEACRQAPLPIDRLAGALGAGAVGVDPTRLSQLALARVRTELEGQARRAFWRRVVTGMVLSLVPLPAVLAYDAYVLRVAYDLVSVLLPAGLAAYLVLSYAASLALLFALTYAAIPLLVDRTGPRRLVPLLTPARGEMSPT
jgi:hypothetical protein